MKRKTFLKALLSFSIFPLFGGREEEIKNTGLYISDGDEWTKLGEIEWQGELKSKPLRDAFIDVDKILSDLTTNNQELGLKGHMIMHPKIYNYYKTGEWQLNSKVVKGKQ